MGRRVGMIKTPDYKSVYHQNDFKSFFKSNFMAEKLDNGTFFKKPNDRDVSRSYFR